MCPTLSSVARRKRAGCWTSDEDRGFVSHARPTQVSLPLGRVCGQCPDTARLHHQRAEKLGNRSCTGCGECRLCGSRGWWTSQKRNGNSRRIYRLSIDMNMVTRAKDILRRTSREVATGNRRRAESRWSAPAELYLMCASPSCISVGRYNWKVSVW